MSGDLYPLQLHSKLSRRIWGGDRLLRLPALAAAADGAPVSGSDEPYGEPFGESWQVYGGNLISNGHLAGSTLQQAADLYGAALLGTSSLRRYGTQFPLLAKLIDAAQPLSLQVHPDDAYARSHEAATAHLGKAEAWVVLDAAPDATIIRGFNADLTEEKLRQAVQENKVMQRVNVIPVQAGAVIYNPPGMVHAIGAGILLYEIQQSSDLTYRLYDYDRRDVHGQPRALHLQQALQVAQLQRSDTRLVATGETQQGLQQLLACEYFVLERISVPAAAALSTRAGSVQLLTCTAGSVTLHSSADELRLQQGASAVLPASLGDYRLAGSGVVMRSYLPDCPD